MSTTYTQLHTQIFSPSTARMAFKLGIAHSHNTIPPALLAKWIDFLVNSLGSIYFGDILSEDEYSKIEILLRELRRWVEGPQGPSCELVKEEERAAPEGWKPPFPEKANFDVWKWEVREGKRKFEARETLKTDCRKEAYEVEVEK